MAIARSIGDFLKRERISYTPIRHRAAYTAQREAALAHVSGRRWAKTVVCFADGEPIQAVLPADLMVDLERLRALAEAETLRLATEAQITELYSECEPGAMPPFGPLYGQRVFMDTSLVGEPEMVFNAGTHTDAVCMHSNDFAEIVRPTVGAFSQKVRIGSNRFDRVR
jgi:Ala-tRNA(Pro) deacylase